MHIAIDARFWGLENTGLGRYVMKLVEELSKIDTVNRYSLLVKQQSISSIPKLGNNFELVACNANHYSVREQFEVLQVLSTIKPDIFHVPHFNIPVLWHGPLVVTLHDLIKKFSVGSQSTTLPAPVYWVKWVAHGFAVSRAVYSARKIIVPSEFTKGQVLEYYRVPAEKIHVTYEAPEDVYYAKTTLSSQKLVKKYGLGENFVVYTGNVYPHKNVQFLIEGVKRYNLTAETPLVLAIVCSRNVFQERLAQFIREAHMEEYVKFLGFVPDEELRDLYREAKAFVTPSLLEGFGLPGLEAMAAGTVVISSDQSSLPEIYGAVALYFDPQNIDDLVKQLTYMNRLSGAKRKTLVEEGKAKAKSYSWKRLAEETKLVYELAGRSRI